LDSPWRPKYEFPSLASAPYIAVDVETYDPELDTKGPGGVRGVGRLVGISLAVPGWSTYLPINHEGGDNLPADLVLRYLRTELQGSQPKLGAKILYDAEWLQCYDVHLGGDLQDIQVREALIDENQYTYDADTLFSKYTSTGKAHELLFAYAATLGHRTEKQVKQNLWRYPARYVGPYAIQDAVGTLEVFLAQNGIIDKAGLNKVLALEVRITRLLLKMRFQGIPVDLDRAEKSLVDLEKLKQEALAKLRHVAGFDVDIWSGQSIEKAFVQLGLPYPKTAKDNPSFTADWLGDQDHDLPSSIIRARQLDRAGNVFIRKKIIDVCYNGRIYPELKQTRSEKGGTRSGRLAASNPNVQQIPARNEELARVIRRIFVPPAGTRWGTFDYSQQEPRITIHYAALRGFIGAAEARQRYIDDPATDYHDLTRALILLKSGVDIKRKDAKTINLGLTYTMGGAKLCRKLGLPTKFIPHWRKPEVIIEVAGEKGEELLQAYHTGMPFIKLLMEDCTRVVKRRGYVITAGGRHCHLPPDKAHIGINRLVQGSSADMTKQAMLNLDDAGYTPFVQVHDEVDNPIETDRQAKEIRDIMVQTGRDLGISVPMMVDVELGPSWGETEEVNVDLY
jgi:DNA polymerase I-like protein with 3'-5' exonuclease and polymerase domains